MISSCCRARRSRIVSPPARWPNSTGRGSRPRAQCRPPSPPNSRPTIPAAPIRWHSAGRRSASSTTPTRRAKRLGGRADFLGALARSRDLSRKISDCGVALPDARDALFIAAWRLMNVDPAQRDLHRRQARRRAAARARPRSTASALRRRRFARPRRGLPRRRGRRARRRRRGARSRRRRRAPIRFAYAKEGGPVSLDALRHSARRAAVPTRPMRCWIFCCARTIAERERARGRPSSAPRRPARTRR